MTTVFLAPDPIQGTKFVPGGNVPASGAQLFCYAAGSSTKQNVYTTNLGNVAWANPIVLDSGGNLGGSNEVWIASGVPMKFVLAPSNDSDPPASPYWTMDNVSGINDTSGASSSTAEWVAGPTPTFVSSTQFTLAGDQTATFTVGRRIKATVTAGTAYATVITSAFAAVTTVTVAGAVLDSGLSAVYYGLLDPANTSIGFYHVSRQASAVLVASATTNIWGSDGNSVHLSSTVTIGSFSSAPYVGALKKVIADSAFTLQNSSTTLILPGGQNKTVAAGDSFDVYADTATKMRILNYTALPSVFLIDSSDSPGLISSSAASTVVYTKSIPAGVLGSTHAIHWDMFGDFFNNTGSSIAFRLVAAYGSTTIADTGAQSFGSGAASRPFRMGGVLSGGGATNVQRAYTQFQVASSGTLNTTMSGNNDFSVSHAFTSIAIDSTIAQSLGITANIGIAHSSATLNVRHGDMVLY